MDIILGSDFRRLEGTRLVDPREFSDVEDVSAIEYFDLQPKEFVLAFARDPITIPPDRLGILFPTSTYLRCGLVFGSGFVKPGWSGHLVLELHNANRWRPLRLYVGDVIASVELLLSNSPLYTGRYKDTNPLEPL